MACIHNAKLIAAMYVVLAIKRRHGGEKCCMEDWVKMCYSLGTYELLINDPRNYDCQQFKNITRMTAVEHTALRIC